MFEKSEALEPLDFVPKLGRRGVLVQQHRWADLDALSRELQKSPSPFQKFLGLASSSLAERRARPAGRPCSTRGTGLRACPVSRR